MQWELNKVKKVDMKLPLLCNAIKAEPIAFLEKMSLLTLMHLCKRFGSKIFVIENHPSLQKALELTEDIDCVDPEYPEEGMFRSEK